MLNARLEHDALIATIRQVTKEQINLIGEISTNGIACEIYNTFKPEEELSFVIRNTAFGAIKNLVQKEIERLSPLEPECSEHEEGTHIMIDGEPKFIPQERYEYISKCL